MTYPVIVDPSVGSGDLIEYSPLDEIAQLGSLDSADIATLGNGPEGIIKVGVEVKAVGDLVGSVKSGRLQDQAKRMLKAYGDRWLVVYPPIRRGITTGRLQYLKSRRPSGLTWVDYTEGKDKKGKPRTVPYAYIASWLVTLRWAGFRVEYCWNKTHLAQWVGILAAKWSKDWDHHDGFRTFNSSTDMVFPVPGIREKDPNLAFRAEWAKQIPGVGYKTAMVVARHFPSAWHMVNAPYGEWLKVEGVGKGIAAAAVRLIRNERG